MKAWQCITQDGEKENPFVIMCCVKYVWTQKQRYLVIAIVFT